LGPWLWAHQPKDNFSALDVGAKNGQKKMARKNSFFVSISLNLAYKPLLFYVFFMRKSTLGSISPPKNLEKTARIGRNTVFFILPKKNGENQMYSFYNWGLLFSISLNLAYKPLLFYVFFMRKSTLGSISPPKNLENRSKSAEIRHFSH
jgi:hypothetical protein